MNTKEEFYRKRVADKQREQLVVKARANILLHDQNHHRSENNIPNMINNKCLKRKAITVEHEALERLSYLNQALELVDDLEPLFEVIKYFEEQALIAVENEEQAIFLDTEIVATQLTRVFNSDYVTRNWMNETESQVKSLQCSACSLICSYVISIRDNVLSFNLFESSTIEDLVKLLHIEDEPLTKATLNLLAAIFSIQYDLISPGDPLQKLLNIFIEAIENNLDEISTLAVHVIAFYDVIDFKELSVEKRYQILNYAKNAIENAIENPIENELVPLCLHLLSQYAQYCRSENDIEGIRQTLDENVLKTMLKIISISKFGDFSEPIFNALMVYFSIVTKEDIKALYEMNISEAFHFQWANGGKCLLDPTLEMFTVIMKDEVGIQIIIDSNILELVTKSTPSQYLNVDYFVYIYEILLHIAKNGSRKQLATILEMPHFFSFLVRSHSIGFPIPSELINIYLNVIKKENFVISNTNENHIQTLQNLLKKKK